MTRLLTAVLTIIFCGALLVVSPKLYADDSLFTIENIEIDVTAENAIKAREQAFEQAQVKAFEELTKRMLSEDAAASFVPPPANKISRLIQDFEVSNEKLASKRYKGTYKIRFKERAAASLFGEQGAPVTTTASAPMLILPFIDQGGATQLWSPQNQWMQAWTSANHDQGLVPLVLPIGDLSDVQDVGDDEALTYSPQALASMLERYNAKEAVIAIAKPSANGGLGVELYRTDRSRPEYAHQIVQEPLAGQNTDMTYRLAVAKVKAALREDWKKIAAVKPQERAAGVVQARARFKSLNEWSTIREAVTRTSAVRELSIKALSPREAYIELRFDGAVDLLKLALQQSGLTLSAPQYQDPSRYQGGGMLDAPNVIYDLSFGRPRSPYGSPSAYQKSYGASSSPSAPAENMPYSANF